MLSGGYNKVCCKTVSQNSNIPRVNGEVLLYLVLVHFSGPSPYDGVKFKGFVVTRLCVFTKNVESIRMGVQGIPTKRRNGYTPAATAYVQVRILTRTRDCVSTQCIPGWDIVKA